jgi:hypothetical protein
MVSCRLYASLVLQHIEPERCASYLADFARMTPAVHVLTRARSDFDTSVFDTIARMDLFDAGECIEVDHDPETHQLRVLGRTRFSDARLSDAGHFEVLLRSTRR